MSRDHAPSARGHGDIRGRRPRHDHGTELVLQAAISVARIQPLADSGRALAVAIGQHLKTTPAHVTGVLAEASLK